VYHFMFGPDYSAGCQPCSAIADGFNGFAVHLANHDVMLWAISRAPLAKLQAFRQRMGWTFPWASSFDSDFNWDFSMSLTEEQQREGGTEYNYRPQPAYTPPKGSGPNIGAQVTGTDPATYARELEVLVVAFGEEVGALPEDERVHVEDVLVDEACGGHRLDELAAAPHEDAAAATRLELLHHRHRVAAEDRRRRPARLAQRARDDVLREVVEAVRGRAGALRPRGGHRVVRRPAVEERGRAVELALDVGADRPDDVRKVA